MKFLTRLRCWCRRQWLRLEIHINEFNIIYRGDLPQKKDELPELERQHVELVAEFKSLGGDDRFDKKSGPAGISR